MLGLCIAIGLAARLAIYHVETDDYKYFVSRWYEFISQNGGFHALKYDLSNYNPPYLYLLALATYLPLSELVAIKSISVIFDVLLAFFTYRILSLKYRQRAVPIFGAVVAFLAPTVIINGAAWGQCDAIYTAFCLGSLYFMLLERPVWACIFFGLAVSFKLQAIFFLPVLAVLLLRDRKSALSVVFVPLTCAVLLLPAIAEGRDVQSLLRIYVDQVETGGMTPVSMPRTAQPPGPASNLYHLKSKSLVGTRPGDALGRPPSTRFGVGRPPGAGPEFPPFGVRDAGAGGGSYHFPPSAFTFNAPSFYQWIPIDWPAYWKWIGVTLAGLYTVALGAIAFLNRNRLRRDIIITAALLSVVAIPFLLPKMHERYFYTADVLSITFAFYFPRYFLTAAIMQLSSLLSYAPYFFNHDAPPAYLPFVSLAVLLLIFVLVIKLLTSLYPDRLALIRPRPRLRKRLTWP